MTEDIFQTAKSNQTIKFKLCIHHCWIAWMGASNKRTKLILFDWMSIRILFVASYFFYQFINKLTWLCLSLCTYIDHLNKLHGISHHFCMQLRFLRCAISCTSTIVVVSFIAHTHTLSTSAWVACILNCARASGKVNSTSQYSIKRGEIEEKENGKTRNMPTHRNVLVKLMYEVRVKKVKIAQILQQDQR